jgi:hypothetical protein
MINFTNVQLQRIIVHKVGNISLEEEITLSDTELELEDESLVQLLLKYFLTSFSGNEMYKFHHETHIDLNEIYVYARKMFSPKGNFIEQSENIAKHLYACSAHPKVKSGELYVVCFKNIILDDETADAIGIFKSESKETYLKIDRVKNAFYIDQEQGVNTNKLDKGCLIVNSKKEEGYQVCIIDNLNKSTEAQYWKDDFLSVKPIANEFHQTNQFMSLTKNFVTKQLTEDFEVTKADQIDLLNRSVEYFKTHESFDKKGFEKEVLQDTGIIKSFRSFDESYREENEIEELDNFDISRSAVKKQAKVFKSVLKLDKNFHIYIHGNRELIEQGVEKDGRKFYKIYFDKEL